ncbi:MAG TPA: gluconokinase [Edaphobacter sp.]|jgi:gluconokinase|nr:gluconokinase [Edaphobacter sp.]
MIVVLMGVSGSGKTTIGKLLADRTGWTFADADDYFPTAYKEKMAAGHALTDDDRAPWLQTLNGLLRRWDENKVDGILACSALREKYHEVLEAGIPSAHIMFVFLDGSKELIAKRLAVRKHEYMNPKLLDSQLATLERPDDAFRVVNDRAPEEIVDQIQEYILQAQELPAEEILE